MSQPHSKALVVKMKFKFWSWNFLPFHLLLFLLLLTSPVFFVEFKPSVEMNEIAAFTGLLIGTLSFPLCISSLIRFSQNNLLHLLALCISFFLLTSLLGWSATNGTIGYLANKLHGHIAIKKTEVISKNNCENKRKCLCNTELRLKTDQLMSNGFLCVTEAFWSHSQSGDIVLLTGIESKYGFEIYEYEKYKAE